jgi:hypothetical protein
MAWMGAVRAGDALDCPQDGLGPSMVPKYCYRVVVTSRNGLRLLQQSRNYETLPGAMAFREIKLGKPMVTRVEVLAVLDEAVRSNGEVRSETYLIGV